MNVNTAPLRRIGAISDVHGEVRTLETVLEFLQAQSLDLILCTGDVVDGPGEPSRCCELLRQNNVPTVAGNHDRWLLAGQARDLPEAHTLDDLDAEALAFLRSLPRTRAFETVAGRLLLCHGLGENDMARLLPDDSGYALQSNMALYALHRGEFRFVLNGHTHRRMVRSFARESGENLTVINAGTLYHAHQPCFVVVDFEARSTQFFAISDAGDIISAACPKF